MIGKFGHLLGGTLLVAGTSIGAGMLALPVATAEAGFLPSILLYLICWMFMLATGLLVLEACIWMPRDANLVTLAQHLLGKTGKVCCWILYLYLFFCLMVAHIAGGGGVVATMSGSHFTPWESILIYVLIFSPIVYLGTLWVDRLNILLMGGVVVTYFLFVVAAIPHLQMDLLKIVQWKKVWWGLPVIFTAFGYQSLIPTLMSYMNRNVKKVRQAIIWGTSIPFIIYVIWEFLVLGIVPVEGPNGLHAALLKGQNAVSPMKDFIQNASLNSVGQTFAFFALTTSYVGISIAFVDFLADGFKIKKKTAFNKLGLCAIVFLIPTVISLVDPTIFITALNYAGGLGVALLLGGMPILMIWMGRYHQKRSLEHSQIRGGKTLLSLMLGFVAIVVVITLFTIK